MCGIAGKVSGSVPAQQELLDQMCAALRHRGPDAQGSHVGGTVALGMRRLAVIDLKHGDQPIYSEDRQTVLVFNGEIYNHLELRQRLAARGHLLAGGSDAEVLVHLWEELGPACVSRLRGMFAFAIWDNAKRRLFIARDRLGKKPLFYAHRGDTLWFGSEPRAILQDPEVPRDIDFRAIDAFLVNQYVPHELCAFAHLRKLPPASYALWEAGKEIEITRYWRPEYGPKLAMSRAEAIEQVRSLVLESTRLRLMSDVPIGAFLSGGVDSSLVVAAMAMSSSETVRTFSVTFPDRDFDESPYSRRVAEIYGTDHTELECAPPTPDLLPRLAWHFGEPFADPAALPTFQLSELMRDRVTVALNGDGGDESFAGYRRYWQLAATMPVEVLPIRARRHLAEFLTAAAGGLEGRSLLPRAARLAGRVATPPPIRYADLFRYLSSADRDALYSGELRDQIGRNDPLAHVVSAWRLSHATSTIDRLMEVDLQSYLPDDLLTKVDITSMAHSLEVRSPLLDQRLVEFAARLPTRWKLQGRDGKRILRDAARTWLPDDLLDRPKQGFAVPVSSWLRNELRDLPKDVLLDPRSLERGLFRPEQTERMIEDHGRGLDRGKKLWALINLELWFRTCVDKVTKTAAEAPVLP